MRSQFGLGILQWWGCCVQTEVDPIVSSPLASCVGPVEGQVPRVVRRLCEKNPVPSVVRNWFEQVGRTTYAIK